MNNDGNFNRRRQFHVRLTDDEFTRLIYLQNRSNLMPRPSLCSTVRACILKTSADAGFDASSKEE